MGDRTFYPAGLQVLVSAKQRSERTDEDANQGVPQMNVAFRATPGHDMAETSGKDMAKVIQARARVLVTGARGNVGREVVKALLARGVPVRAAGRADRERDSPAADGVETVALDLADPRTFLPAVKGCDSLFLLRPPAIANTKATLNPFIDTARANGVGHVVFLSVAGAAANKLVPHHAVEQHLLAGALPYTLLRPGFFSQNLGDAYRRDIAEDRRIYVPAGRSRVAFVDVRDVAEVAALAFVDPASHAGKAYTLTGAEAVTFSDAAALLSEALGVPIHYVPASLLGYWRHLRRRGMPAGQVAVQTILHVGLRFGQAEAPDSTLAGLLEHPPKTLRDYVRDHVGTWAVTP
jgi:uncharacterized protein YbjT (DUF2867 family)